MMKKLLLLIPLFLLAFGLNSCNSDDDSTNNVDVLVGSWKITDIKTGGMSVYDILMGMPEGCFLNSKVHFYNDFTMKINPYEVVNETCVLQPDQMGNWSRNGDTYSYTLQGETTDSVSLNFVNNNQFFYTVDTGDLIYEVYFSRM